MTQKKPGRYVSILRGVKLPWVLIVCSMAFSVLMMRSELQVATLTAGIIDTSQSAIDGGKLLNYIFMVILVALCNIAGNYFTRKMEETISLGVRVKLWDKIMTLPAGYYEEEGGDALVTRVTSDAEAPASLFSMAVSFVTCVVTAVQGFGQLFTYNRLLATWSLLIIPITFLICLFYGKFMFRLGVYSTVTVSGSMAYLAERVRNFRLIKSALAEKLEAEKGDGTFRDMYRADFLSWLMVAGYQLAQGLFSILFIVIVFVIGGQLIPTGEVTIGDLTGFYMISGIVSMQLMQFFMNVGSVSGIFGNMQKISQILDASSEEAQGKSVPAHAGDLELRNVYFAYGHGQPALKNVSLTIPEGKVTALIGGNGAGKTTLFKLLTRLYTPYSGEILYAGENIQNYAPEQWRSRFACVFQDMPLIGGTVRENITYGLNRPVSEEELIAVAKRANCYDFIQAKPKGFDEDVGLDGSNFSGGQAQCISIARAMLRDAELLLLDEATSNLDACCQAQVMGALDNLTQGKTTLIIAHSYAAVRNADTIIVMKEGTVEAAGTPEDLSKTSEFFRLFRTTVC